MLRLNGEIGLGPRARTLAAILLLAACAPATGAGTGSGTGSGTGTGAPAPDPSPWSRTQLRVDEVPAAYATTWRAAENRQSCALLAPRTLGTASVALGGATARAATFAGGWGVAYDLPGTRSAFGVAGTGALASEPGTYDQWPHRRRWVDGSQAGYGPEGGGAGPNQLAYLTIPGQRCLYNVWSRLGQGHLESLLEQLRFVDVR